MPPLVFARTILFVMAVLAFLTGTVLDGVMMRYFVHPMLRLGERMGDEAARPPRPLAFMFERAWARRLYHLLFAALLFAGWWYLGTPTGISRWMQLARAPLPANAGVR